MMDKLLNKTVKINHCNNIYSKPRETINTLQVTVWDVREYDDDYVMINGGWLFPIVEANELILEK